MIRQIFTFGIGHGLAGHYVVIEDIDANRCRERMIDLFGTKWSMQYNDEKEAGVDRWNLQLLHTYHENGKRS